MKFEYAEDRRFFRKLLCKRGRGLSAFANLFDFRPPHTKRAEFNRKMRTLRADLIARYGKVCQLRLLDDCGLQHGLAVDHLIPLSSNKLNKELRQLAAKPGRKVATQSFGSNDPANLVLACGRCNGYKKHRFLEPSKVREILSRKRAF
jgi:5-methylcytosine-specific restriction endonuclease McrA